MDQLRVNRQHLWIIIAAAFALAAVVAAAWAMDQRRRGEQAGIQLEAAYQAAFHSLVEHVENVELLLSKSLVSATPSRQAVTLTRVHAEASAAQDALSRLPVSTELQRSQQFLAQLADFSYMLAENIAAGQAPTPKDWTTLTQLKNQTGDWLEQLNEARRMAATGRQQWTTAAMPAGTGLMSSLLPAPPTGAGELHHSLAELDRQLQETPVLVYDGPFSEQNLRPKPKTSLGRRVTQKQAAEAAVDFLTAGGGGGDKRRWEVKVRDAAEGPIPTYAFEIEDNGSRPVYIEVSRQGGRVISFLAYETPRAGSDIPVDEAQALAQSYLEERGFNGFVSTGWTRENGRITFSFAATRRLGDETIILYPELVKVTVGAGGDRVTGFDARAYWLNRQPGRTFPPEKERLVSPEDAASMINPLLQAEQVRPAVIPLPGGGEAFVYEVLARIQEDRFLLYYNVTTGREEMILRVVESPDHRLTF